MRRTSTVLAAAVFAALIPLGSAQAAPTGNGCSAAGVRQMLRQGDMETVVLRTFTVQLKAAKKVYRVGETAVVKATVTRPANEDPLGLGQDFDPPMSFPAEEVNVGIGLRVGDVFLFGFAVTDANGRADIEIDIKSYTPAGKAIADGFAWKRQVEQPCANVEENGYTFAPGIFKIVKL